MECLCGCKGISIKGCYLPGHDQKLRMQLEARVGGLEALKDIIESLERCLAGDISQEALHQIIEDLEELESIRSYDRSNASGDESIPFEQAVREIERARHAAARVAR